ncbi:MAG: hypothetical protein ACQESR_23500 [Planctomycetota bacterium]
MNDTTWLNPFRYAERSLVRRHGPQGYTSPYRYKPWLRDEFQFRCAYCLCRERWCPDGDDAFSVEHFHAQVLAPNEICEYDNLLYTCCRCNAAKQGVMGILNPAEVPLAEHLEILSDGRIRGLTDQGWELIGVCQLARTKLTEFRRGIFEILGVIQDLNEPARRQILQRYFGFPVNLPRLATLRPPGGNSRPQGIQSSFYERRCRGDLPPFYW